MSFDQFLQIVFTKKMTAVLPRKWDDGFEQYWLEYLKAPHGKKCLERFVMEHFKDVEEYVSGSVAVLESLVGTLYNTVYAICFTEAGDEELLWGAKNKDDKTIMICTTASMVNRLGNNTELFGPALERIQYDLEDHGGINELLNKLGFVVGMAELNSPYDLVLHKRKCFAYEKEIRLLCSPNDLNALKDNDGKRRETVELDLPENFIQNVMVCPTAKDRHVKLVRDICEHFGLPFLGKSSLYNFKVLD